jgi:hypothetical protein
MPARDHPHRPLLAIDGARFSGLIGEIGAGKWRAFAWVRLDEPNHTLEQTIGPQTLATVSTARRWLSRAAARRGFENFDIVVERLGDDGLLVESMRSGSVVDHVITYDVDA